MVVYAHMCTHACTLKSPEEHAGREEHAGSASLLISTWEVLNLIPFQVGQGMEMNGQWVVPG